ncbi:GNAT family protein [Compostibacter hankyongensis]|uniref:GNAT family protein n=1 Tax=Compostibacter hankyongensis TaxID=1007089 RepID=A0ABP8FJS1_9BACT
MRTDNKFYFPVLENDRVRLRPLETADVEALLPVALQPSLWKMGLQDISGEAQLREYIEEAVRQRTEGEAVPILIFDKQAGATAGSTRLMSISLPHKRLEIGATWIGESFQGTGLNKHMKLLMLEYAFETMGMNRVELKTDMLNEKSRRAILSLGAREEGVFRRHMITAGGRLRDSVYYSIIREEWPEVKEKLLQRITMYPNKILTDETLAKR